MYNNVYSFVHDKFGKLTAVFFLRALKSINFLCNAESSWYHYPIKDLSVWSEKILIGGNLFTTSFRWIIGKIQFFENCRHEFHLFRRDYTTTIIPLLHQHFFCRREIIWVRKTVNWANYYFYCCWCCCYYG